MDRILFKLSRVSSVVLVATFLLSSYSAAKAQTTTDTAPSDSTNAEVLRTDSAYKTLQQLATKYECLPQDSVIFTSKRRVISRQVFATNLSNCLQSIEELVARRRKPAIKKRRVVAPEAVEATPPAAPETVTPPPTIVQPEPTAPVTPVAPVDVEPEVSQQDLDAIKELVAAFDSELAAVEKRITSKSFSITTKLVGEGIISFSGYGGVRATATRLDSNNIFTNRLRLNFDTSFTGKDRLRSRLQSRNTTPLNAAATGTNMTRLGYDGNDGEDNTLLSLFQYDFPIGDQTKVRIAPIGYEFNDNQPTLNPLLSSSANGSISRFGRFNPIFRLSGDGAAVNVSQKLSNELSLDVGYAVPATSTSTASTLTPSNGFFKGQNAVLSQLTYAPSKDFSVAVLYGRSYNNAGGLTGGTGSAQANSPFGSVPTTANHYSFLATYKLGDSAVISGWAGLIEAKRETTAGGTASISNYALTLAFPDFGAEGNTLGFVFGIPPKLNSLSTGTTGNPDTSYHLEALYKVKLNDSMDITPGLLLITNPEHNSTNPTEYVGTLRTTYRF